MSEWTFPKLRVNHDQPLVNDKPSSVGGLDASGASQFISRPDTDLQVISNRV